MYFSCPSRIPTFRIASACVSHFPLPSLSVIDPKRRKTCVTVILANEDPLELDGVDVPKFVRSNPRFVGEVKP